MPKRVVKTYGVPNDQMPGISFKALPDQNGQTGRFEAIVSVFGNVDLVGDRVVKGAFSKSLQRWQQKGAPIPVIWSHDWGDPFAHVGAADPFLAEETDVGLKLVGTFDVHEPFAAKVYDLVKSNRVREWSFAYDVQEEQRTKDGANELRVLDLIEAGPTLKGANPDTFTLGVKNSLEAAAKAGRVLSSRNEQALRAALDNVNQAVDDMRGILAALTGSEVPQTASQTASSTTSQPEPIVNVIFNNPAPDEQVKLWLEAEVKAWLDAEKAYEPEEKDWQHVNGELKRFVAEINIADLKDTFDGIEAGLKVSDGLWDGSASRFTDDQWKRACAACRGTESPPKTDCFLPHHEPAGMVSRAGVHAAAGRFAQTQAPDTAKAAARAHLAGHYRNDLDETVPDGLKSEPESYGKRIDELLDGLSYDSKLDYLAADIP